MGRKLRRQEERKNKNRSHLKQEEITTDVNGLTALKIIIAVVLILLVLYYIVAVFITKEIDVSRNSKEANTTTNIADGVTNKILASTIFNQKEEVYYVYFYDFNVENDTISSAINSASDLKIYHVDTSSSLNSKYVTDQTGNRNVDDISNLLVKDPTLLEITNNRVTGYYEGKDSIIEFLNS